MAINIVITHTGAGTGDGSKDKPYQSGGIYFKAVVTGQISGLKMIWQHRWVVGGQPIPENIETPEMWYGRDGAGTSPSFHPTRKTTLSAVEIRAWVQGHEEVVETLVVWVMAAADEPEPMFTVQCDDGLARVTRSELDWLKSEGLVEMVPPRPRYDGTIAELRQALENSEPTDPPIEPGEPPDIHPDSRVSLQICYPPVHGVHYDVNGMRTSPKADIDKMLELGARAVCLWVNTSHLFYNTKTFSRFNDCVLWYDDFISTAKDAGLTVLLGLPFWGLPNWYDLPGVPEHGSQRYRNHLDAKAQVATMINQRFSRADYVVVGREPQLTCSIYPNAPVVDGSAPRWDRDTIVAVTRDTLALADYLDNFKLIGPAISGAVGKVVEPETCYDPKEFLTKISGDLDRWGYGWCGVNAYQLDVFRVPTFENYGRFYQELSWRYAVWPIECGVARKNVPTDKEIKRHFQGLIDQTMIFSPQLFSCFSFHDFNDDGWGVVRADGSLDVRGQLLKDTFSDEVPIEAVTRALPARVRSSADIDCGIQLMQTVQAATIDVKVEFWRSTGRWDANEGFVDTDKPGKLIGSAEFALGPNNPVAFNVWRDLGLDEIDVVLVKSTDDLSTVAVWVTPTGGDYQYAGFPKLS